MTEHYEEVDESANRVLSNRQVLGFVMGYWLRRPWLLAGTLVTTLAGIGFDLAMPWASGRLVDAVTAGPSSQDTAWVAWGLFVGVYLVGSLMRNLAPRFWIPLAAGNMREITEEGFGKVQSFSADWHGDNFSGATVRKLSRAMWGYDEVSDAVVMWLGPALAVLLGLSVMMILRWPMVGLFSLATVIFYIASNVFLTSTFGRPLNLKSVGLDSRIGGAIADSVASNATVRAFGAEDREATRIAGVTQLWSKAVQRTWTRFTDIWLVQNLLLVLLQAGLTGLLLRLWARGEATPGDVAFGVTSFMLMSGYLRNIGDNIRMLQKGLDDVEDVARYLTLEPQVADAPGAPAFAGDLGEVVFDRATFGYKSAQTALYRDFSLRIAPGERIALVGPTGSGKSTFVKLVQRLYDLDGGRILIDGQDVAKVTQGSLRRAIAVVPQDPALFHRTIGENISYARPEATRDEIELAARRARAHDFITRLPRGYETLVGERGVKLSGGERQRVAIARAFLADAPILVLDEATSSLDVETEREVQAAMEELMVGRTTIVIAHRLSTIRGADRILVFDNGQVVEEGRHAELVSRGGAYARLHAVTMGAV
ncbi:MAG: ABC transporter ATP-binding protein [Phenylobacterium sp.]|uniref:ABC transporter ATP-binding protein n=1 Tax=Phenylobacterium sp. TaxID=1871053 RepID=UPI00271A8743|nr:ABC transporter ATP-binding protein [Phenylobacterium sp.]MDO8911640.1 ABC transporter ATP-binding protein [Phenylobacterium sp.]MDP3099448.1 ABC transporter ATP-binding protein [Phenylobacterium sp.]MDP3870001.1 ABC transporter ATP-binding protein [Phenylobacterium sp.]